MLGARSDVPDLCDGINPSTLRVHAPTDVIFLCGGQTRVNGAPPRPESLRDAFQRVRIIGRLAKYSVILAEDILPFYPQANYLDLLQFESHVAQICELIVLFSESDGSLCELGAFSMDQEISRKLLTVIQRKYYDKKSFVRLGPIQSQIRQFGQESIVVLNDTSLGIAHPNVIEDIDLKKFEVDIDRAIASSLKSGRRLIMNTHSTFDKSRPGHLIKLITGIIQHYGSMTEPEIDLILKFLGVDIDARDIKNYIVCAKFVDWIVEDPVGQRVLYSAKPGNRAISFRVQEGFRYSSRDAWLLDAREYWKKSDPERFDILSQAAAV